MEEYKEFETLHFNRNILSKPAIIKSKRSSKSSDINSKSSISSKFEKSSDISKFHGSSKSSKSSNGSRSSEKIFLEKQKASLIESQGKI